MKKALKELKSEYDRQTEPLRKLGLGKAIEIIESNSRKKHRYFCSREHFVNVLAGIKRFDIKSEGHEVGDIIIYVEMSEGSFTGREMKVKIQYILDFKDKFILQIKKCK